MGVKSVGGREYRYIKLIEPVYRSVQISRRLRKSPHLYSMVWSGTEVGIWTQGPTSVPVALECERQFLSDVMILSKFQSHL
jgi:hypothetical protein